MDRCRHKGRSKMFPTLLQTPSFDVRVCSELSCTVKVSVECKDGREGQKKRTIVVDVGKKEYCPR
jgi:hypothetical protein